MKIHGRTSIHEFLGDFVVYRNLVPFDRRLPSLDDVREPARVPENVTPRKSEPAYGRVIVALLREARAIEARGADLKRLIYVGDTRMNDGTAFTNVSCAAGWPGMAFIASEKDDVTRPQVVDQEGNGSSPRTLYLADHWAALGESGPGPSFEQLCRQRGFPIDEHTAVIVDLDKTALGARGRNDQVINEARVEAVRRTVGELLGDAFDPDGFQAAYDVLNQPEFHAFTADNQDYLAYVCLVLGSGLYQLPSLAGQVRRGDVETFGAFIAEVDNRSQALPASLREIHERIYQRVRAGDPTPFKAFRYTEYRATVERMNCLSDDAGVQDLLAHEIVLTQEVREAALRWRGRGALLFGLSDKPDEASLPTESMAARGFEPIHRTKTHAVGETYHSG